MKQFTLNQTVKLIEQNKITLLKNEINRCHSGDISQIINNLSEEYQILVFKLLNLENAADVLHELYDEVRENIIENTPQKNLFNIVDEMDSDEATDLVSELEEDLADEILSNIDKEDSAEIVKLLKYDEESAGGLMQTEIIAVQQNMKRDEVIEYIRKNVDDAENIHYVFVVDDDNKLLGLFEVTKLLLAEKNKQAIDLMEDEMISVNVDVDQEETAHLFRKYDLFILPVIDAKNHLLGRITVDDIIDVIDEEASEDAYKMVGLENEDRVFTTPLNSVKKRLPWLSLNLFTALLVSSVVGVFQQTIENLSILAVLMPIVAGLGGNSGTQTLTVITRGIALGELTIHNTSKAILKEITVGTINGIIVGSAAMLMAYLLKGDIMLGVVLGVAMICNMFIAGLVGSIIPVVMKLLKIDPALASSVIITMLTDIGGFASFLGLATLLL
ncbi:MAG: magnesium transporter [Candidatus Cloacimonetes bacterium]|jgi:magnesium transporter|nr:magnesium transporter [Candidatus Cloacimonadota bacterium]MBT6993538.1 magnesium transporter [Candidatus Cloacimonadota bacterium]MBT7468902.1 magnesium transporter [Candidatus Cloacimonadota bacterium]